jgi:hypothetical protein
MMRIGALGHIPITETEAILHRLPEPRSALCYRAATRARRKANKRLGER